MNFKEFESLIGKDITYTNHILLTKGFEHKDLIDINIYSAFDSYKWFYGMPYNIISITTDENKMVKDIIIDFHGVIDSNFYDSFILDYGSPDTIQVIDGYNSIGKWTEGDPNHRVRKVTLKTKEGVFEDDPLFMIWNKKGYQVKILTKHEQNISVITFRIPTTGF